VAREHPGRVGGTEDGESVFWDEKTHADKRRDQGPYTYAAQILLNPKADAAMGFKREWLRKYARLTPRGMNGYILVDSANSKRKESDYSSCWVVLLGTDGNFCAIPEFRDRLNLTERCQRVIEIHRRWKADGVKWQQVRWERYGMMADIEALKREQETQNYRFDVTEVAGQTSKDDRIRRLIPLFEQGKVYLPMTKHITDWEKNTIDIVHSFIEEEYYPFPTCLHKDMLDSLSRIAEPELTLIWPREETPQPVEPPSRYRESSEAWMA
jgi:phage terminase large subunit-like protein